MSDIPLAAIRESVAAAIESGQPLDLEREAHRIARLSGPGRDVVRSELRAASRKADVARAAPPASGPD